jgi:hypothetical protein
VISANHYLNFCLVFAVGGLACGCGDSPRKTPDKGTYGQLNTRPSTNIPAALTPQPFLPNAAAALTSLQTELSPATLFHTETNTISFFTRLDEFGLGAPSYAAFDTSSGPRAFKNGEFLNPGHMEQNWVMVWFAGARGWTRGDIPCVVYLQHKPASMRLDTNGLHFRFHGPAGDFVLLPLYGSYVAPAEGNQSSVTFAGKKLKTWEWSKVLTREPLMRVRYWASALREFPVYCQETFSVDRSTDTLTIRQKLTYRSIDDDWATKHLKLNPISPSLAPAAKDPQSPVKFSRPVMDLEMPTPYGPYMAAEVSSPLEAKLSILQYINEEPKGRGAGVPALAGSELPPITNVVSAPGGHGSWARWGNASADAIDPAQYIALARQAYRAGDIDAYNYGSYLFARAFILKHSSAAAFDASPSERLIPSAPPPPFVIGIEREALRPSPALVQSIETLVGKWPHLLFQTTSTQSEPWTIGSVKPSSRDLPSRLEGIPLNWNTRAFELFP